MALDVTSTILTHFVNGYVGGNFVYSKIGLITLVLDTPSGSITKWYSPEYCFHWLQRILL